MNPSVKGICTRLEISADSLYYSLLVHQFAHDYLQCQTGIHLVLRVRYIVCAGETQSLKSKVRHLLQYEFGGTDPAQLCRLSCACWPEARNGRIVHLADDANAAATGYVPGGHRRMASRYTDGYR